mmetsp:Transcript_141542/g.394441  ORF Transcript_141542/g.394441 Transcript_141542/m.394441 type:complete len:234 (-) Transcript_141542:345-1046(-)
MPPSLLPILPRTDACWVRERHKLSCLGVEAGGGLQRIGCDRHLLLTRWCGLVRRHGGRSLALVGLGQRQLGQQLAEVPVHALIPHDRPVLAVARPGDRAVREVPQVLDQPLDVGRRHPGDLQAGMLLEDVVREVDSEPCHVVRTEEVDESIPNICPVVHVHREVEEIVCVSEACFVDLLEEAVLRVLVGDVAEHGRGRRLFGAFSRVCAERARPSWDCKGMVRAEGSPRCVVA